MKISVSLFLYFNTLPHEHELDGQIEIRGTLNSPDRPQAGEEIYWPWLEGKYKDPHDQDSSLTVVWSDFHTVSPGKILPRIHLECRGGGDHQENQKHSVIDNVGMWNETHKSIHRLLLNPTVRWGGDYVFIPFPTEASGLPSALSANFKQD